MVTIGDFIPNGWPSLVVWTILVILGAQLLRTYSRLQSVPGPFLAALSNLPRLYWTWTKTPFNKHIALHKKYGGLVRLGPNMVSVGDPAEISTIYGFNYNFQKVWTSWVAVFPLHNLDTNRPRYLPVRLLQSHTAIQQWAGHGRNNFTIRTTAPPSTQKASG